jgi:hypothetical protein
MGNREKLSSILIAAKAILAQNQRSLEMDEHWLSRCISEASKSPFAPAALEKLGEAGFRPRRSGKFSTTSRFLCHS